MLRHNLKGIASALGIVLVSCGPADRSAQMSVDTLLTALPVTDANLVAIQEGYPLSVIELLDMRAGQLAAAFAMPRDTTTTRRVQSLLDVSKTWRPGETLQVAFNGGSADLRRRIAQAARYWSEAATSTSISGPTQPNTVP